MDESAEFEKYESGSSNSGESGSDEGDVTMDKIPVETIRPTVRTIAAVAGAKKLLISQNRHRGTSTHAETSESELEDYHYSHITSLLPAELLAIQDSVFSQLQISNIDPIVSKNLKSAHNSFHNHWQAAEDPQSVLRNLHALRSSSDFINKTVTAAQDYIATTLSSRSTFLTLIKYKDMLIDWLSYSHRVKVSELNNKVTTLSEANDNQRDEIERLSETQKQLRERVSNLQVKSVLVSKFESENKRNRMFESSGQNTHKPTLAKRVAAPADAKRHALPEMKALEKPRKLVHPNDPNGRSQQTPAPMSSSPSPTRWGEVSTRQSSSMFVFREIIKQFACEMRGLCSHIRSTISRQQSQVTLMSKRMNTDLLTFISTFRPIMNEVPINSTTTTTTTSKSKRSSIQSLASSKPLGSSDGHLSLLRRLCVELGIPAEVHTQDKILHTESILIQKVRLAVENGRTEEIVKREAFLNELETVAKMGNEIRPVEEISEKLVLELKELVCERSDLVLRRIVKNTKYRRALARVKRYEIEAANSQQITCKETSSLASEPQPSSAFVDPVPVRVPQEAPLESICSGEQAKIQFNTNPPLVPAYVTQLHSDKPALIVNINASRIKQLFLDTHPRSQHEFCLWLDTYRNEIRRYVNRVTEAEARNVLKKRILLAEIKNFGQKQVRKHTPGNPPQVGHVKGKSLKKAAANGTSKSTMAQNSWLPFEVGAPPPLPSQSVSVPNKSVGLGSCWNRRKSIARMSVPDAAVFLNKSPPAVRSRTPHPGQCRMPPVSKSKKQDSSLKWIRRDDQGQSTFQQLVGMSQEQPPCLPMLML